MRWIVLLFLLSHNAVAGIYTIDIRPKDYNTSVNHNIKILDQKNIDISKIGSFHFAEASDLAYDVKKHILYMVGDRGYLYSFDINLSDKIESIKPLNAHLISKKNAKRFRRRIDSEGLALDKNGTLLISFERKPQIAIFDTNASRISKLRLPKELSNKHNYKSPNKMLESVAIHPKYGILTAAEYPLRGSKKRVQTIYSLHSRQWHFLSEAGPKDGISAIEIMDDGNVLVLERDFESIFRRIITLKEVYLNKISNGLCRTKVLLRMDSSKGWDNDNFEGLTRVAPNRYLMVSDNNNNIFERTFLIYFKIRK